MHPVGSFGDLKSLFLVQFVSKHCWPHWTMKIWCLNAFPPPPPPPGLICLWNSYFICVFIAGNTFKEGGALEVEVLLESSDERDKLVTQLIITLPLKLNDIQ